MTVACVLVVDEYPPFREAMEYCLPKFGHDAVTAEDLPAAQALAGAVHVDVILLDVGLPQLTGIHACEELRRDPRLAGVKIVMMTLDLSDDIVRRSRAAGAAEVVEKPFLWPDLLSVLARVTRGAS